MRKVVAERQSAQQLDAQVIAEHVGEVDREVRAVIRLELASDDRNGDAFARGRDMSETTPDQPIALLYRVRGNGGSGKTERKQRSNDISRA